MRDWMKVMLGEIDRKKSEAAAADEEKRRRQEEKKSPDRGTNSKGKKNEV